MLDKFVGREIFMFRCHFNPMIGPRPQQAFVPKDQGMYAELTSQGVYVKVLKDGCEHFVPFSNIESLRFAPEKEQDDQVIELKRKGKPSGQV